MSLAAVLIATRDHLVTLLGLDPLKLISVEEDAQPPPWAGDVYYVVHPILWGPHHAAGDDASLDEEYGLAVTISMKRRGIPTDKLMKQLFLKALTGMEKRLREVMLAIGGPDRYTLMQSVNKITEGTEALCEPFRWVGSDVSPEPKDGTWWGAEPISDAGWIMAARFSGARRIQRVFKVGTADDLE